MLDKLKFSSIKILKGKIVIIIIFVRYKGKLLKKDEYIQLQSFKN